MAENSPFDEEPGRLLAQSHAGDNANALSVSEISARLKRHVETGFSHVRIRGEISGFKRAASGHLYLSLKDADARIDGVMWKGNAARLAFVPSDGVEVIATGKLTTYPGRSNYQIVMESMEIAGEGALLALLEKLKARLAAEGLFAPERKRRLPYLPRVIGVVTSPTGAVIRDILHRLEDRCPARVIVWPVLVQGQGSAAQVAAAVNGFSAMKGPDRPDLVIVARGGGSIEDLWGFNEEAVVRAVASCSIPVISAVGHETDTTLCDFAADMRAPTPTAAAEMAVPVKAELQAGLGVLGARSLRALTRYRERASERLSFLTRRMPTPDSLLGPQRQRVDDMGDRARRALGRVAADARGDLASVSGRLRPLLLTQKLDAAERRLTQLWRVAQTLNPDSVLQRGYARVERRSDGATLSSAGDARKAASLRLRFADGALDVEAGSEPARVDALRKPAKPRSSVQQTELF